MFRIPIWLAWVAFVPPALGVTAEPLQRGFEQNVGQYDRDILFALNELIFYRKGVQLTHFQRLSLEFVNGNPLVTVEGRNPLPFPLNLYLGSDPQRWRENVPHFSTVRYTQIYPGIDAEWNTGTGLPMLRLVLAPGTSAQQLLLRLHQADQKLDWTVLPYSVAVSSAGFSRFSGLVAYQMDGSSKSRVAVTFSQVDENSFRVAVGAYDAVRPLVIEFGLPYGASLYPSELRPRGDGSVVMAHGDVFGDSPYLHGSLGAVSPNGDPIFLSLFDGLIPAWIVPGRDGDLTVADTITHWLGDPPVAASAPRPVPRSTLPDAWVGRFGSDGRLRASTFVGGALSALAVDSSGAVYLATQDSVMKWTPGVSRFGFTVPVRGVCSLSTNSFDNLAFAAALSEGQPTTSGALKRRYEGPWDLYVGKLDRLSGSIEMATYVPIIGQTSLPFSLRSSLSLAPSGSLWIASAFNFYDRGRAHTLVALNAAGARVIHSESVPAFPQVSFDTLGNVLVASSTHWRNLPTVPDAPLRAACQFTIYPDDFDAKLHLRILSPAGALLNATYLRAYGEIVAFDGLDQLFVKPSPLSPDLERVDTRRPAKPGIACVIHTASRQPLTNTAPGGLLTLVGNDLGPLEQTNAAFDGKGSLPLRLAGVQVLINGIAMPLVSVQQGLITFYLPANTPPGVALVEVWSLGNRVASAQLVIADVPSFALFAADGSGRGPVAALNEDGTVNAQDNPAKLGSVVTVFGTGVVRAANPVSLTGRVGPVRPAVAYDGPAPGLVPGVRQINMILPDNVAQEAVHIRPEGAVFLVVASASRTHPPTIIYLRP